MKQCLLVIVLAVLADLAQAGAPAWKDLTPVTLKRAPSHRPLTLADAGKSSFSICVMSESPQPTFAQALSDLQECIAEATGAKLPIVRGKIALPAIVIGDCPEARAAGIDAAGLPPEGFEIKTAAEAIFIVGQEGAHASGTAWGIFDFLERFVGVRNYWPADKGGRSVLPLPTLVVPPVWLADAPICRMREDWPPFASSPWFGHQELRALHASLRSGSSWPIRLAVHCPRDWAENPEYLERRKEVYRPRDGAP